MGRTITTRHDIVVDTPPEQVYAIVADVGRWPVHFPPTVHARRVEGDDTDEIIELWALANGELRNWTSHRTLDAATRTVRFAQTRSVAPVEAMSGSWHVEDGAGPGSCRAVLLHSYSLVDDDDEVAAQRVARAVDDNSNAELAALKRAAEVSAPQDGVFSFQDSAVIEGDTAAAYEFVRDCAQWPERIPHVSALDVTETGDLQLMTMDTAAPDGSVHTTKSARVCFAEDRIVYKQTTTPEALEAHVGEWSFRPTEDGVEVTSTHWVVLSPEGLDAMAARGVRVSDPHAAVRHSLGTNSMATIESARQHVAARTGR